MLKWANKKNKVIFICPESITAYDWNRYGVMSIAVSTNRRTAATATNTGPTAHT